MENTLIKRPSNDNEVDDADITDLCRYCALIAIQQGWLTAGQGIDIYAVNECTQPAHNEIIELLAPSLDVIADFGVINTTGLYIQ